MWALSFIRNRIGIIWRERFLKLIYLIIRRCARTGAFPGAFCVPNSVALCFTYPAGRELGHSLVPIRITARVIRLKKNLFPQHFRTNMADWLRFHFVIARRRYSGSSAPADSADCRFGDMARGREGGKEGGREGRGEEGRGLSTLSTNQNLAGHPRNG